MSQPVANQTQTPAPISQAEPPSRVLETAAKAAKVTLGFFIAIIGVASMGIGVTIIPFAPEFGAGAIALATTMFVLAGCFFYSGASSSSLESRHLETVVSSSASQPPPSAL